MDFSSLLPSLVGIARDAGKIIVDSWDAPRAPRHKGKTDLVTETDLKVQAQLKKDLGELLPGSAFLGEEGEGAKTLGDEPTWIVDPVDGTTNFVHRVPFVSVSVALTVRRAPALGVVCAPMLNECFWAALGQGAWLNSRPIKVSETLELADALMATGFPYEMERELEAILARLSRVLPATQGLRRLGSAAIDLAYVACGRLDAYYEATLKPWDMAAGWLLVKEAGGDVTALDGGPATPGGSVLASNGFLHASVLRLVNLEGRA